MDMGFVAAQLEATLSIYEREANIKVTTVDYSNRYIDMLAEAAPEYALNPQAFSWDSTFSDADDYFRERARYFGETENFAVGTLGVGAPTYCFIVDEVQGAAGSAFLFGQNYFVVGDGSGKTTMAHELGHLLGLLHTDANHNLMNSSRDTDKDSELSQSQVCWIRTASFVTFTRYGDFGLSDSSNVAASGVGTAPAWFWVNWG
jgi:hypothetical protein